MSKIIKSLVFIILAILYSHEVFASGEEEPMKPSARVVFSFDGGGVRGVMGVVMLVEIEKHLPEGSHIVDYVDLFAGTSTGGLIAIALAKSQPLDLGELLRLYQEESADIFTPNNWSITKNSLGKIGLFGFWQSITGKFYSKYDANNFERVLNRYVSESEKLNSCSTHLLCPALCTQTGRLEFFKTSMARISPERNCDLTAVAMATAAAPTIFPFKSVKFDDGHTVSYVDGGLQAVNPTVSAYVEATKVLFPGEEVFVVSFGASDTSYPLSSKLATSGSLYYAEVMPMVMSDPHPMDYIAENLIPEGHYFRLQPEQTGVALDDVSKISYLIRATSDYIELPETQKMIRQIAGILVASKAGIPNPSDLKLKSVSLS